MVESPTCKKLLQVQLLMFKRAIFNWVLEEIWCMWNCFGCSCFAMWKLAPLSWPVRFETDFFAFCFPDLVCIVMPRGSLNLRYVIKTLWILICIFVKCIGGSTNQWLLLKYTKRFVFACYVSPHPLHPCHSAELCLSILRSIFSLVSIVLLRCALSDRWRTFAPATNQ